MWLDLLRVFAIGRKSSAGNAPKTMPLVVGELAMFVVSQSANGAQAVKSWRAESNVGFLAARECAVMPHCRPR